LGDLRDGGVNKILGKLCVVIGPSGSGKDTLISGAKLLLNNEKRYVFAQREITRPKTDDAEDHIEIPENEFKQKQLANVYSLSWYANGLNYGVTRLDEYMRQEKFVILNGSRGALKDIRQKYKDTIIIQVEVPPELLRERLISRGREDSGEIDARLARGGALRILDPTVINFINDKPKQESTNEFVAILKNLSNH
jgi:phosphonate metabolism protein PhnN/1,5-bisphosphokinase (PRPP-forming)